MPIAIPTYVSAYIYAGLVEPSGFLFESTENTIGLGKELYNLINLFSDFKKYKLDNKNWATDLYLRDDPHWTEKAHQLVAKKVYRYLKK